LARDAEDGGTASAERWAEEIGVFPDRILDSCAASLEFIADFVSTFQREQWVREGVIADCMSGSGELANDIGALLDMAADEKECGSDVVLGQDFQQVECMRIVWSVVVCEGELPASAREAREGAAVPLAGGSHGLVTGGNGGCNCGDRSELNEHCHTDCKWSPRTRACHFAEAVISQLEACLTASTAFDQGVTSMCIMKKRSTARCWRSTAFSSSETVCGKKKEPSSSWKGSLP